MTDARIPAELLAHLSDDVAAALTDVRTEAVRRVRARLVDSYAEHLEQAAYRSDIGIAANHNVPVPNRQSRNPKRDGLYLYGVVAGDGTGAGEGAEGVLPGTRVQLVRVDDLTALVSEIDVDDFAHLDIASDTVQLDESSSLARAVRSHDAVIDAAFRAGPVIPVRFGTILPETAAITELIHRHAGELRHELARLGSHVEWGVKLYADGGEPNEEEAHQDAGGSGSDYLLAKQRGRERAVAQRNGLNDAIALFERSVSELAAAEVVGAVRPTGTETPLFSASYLLALSDEQQFLETVENVQDSLLSQGIRIERTGPWPPYHFVTVRLDDDLLAPLGEAP